LKNNVDRHGTVNAYKRLSMLHSQVRYKTNDLIILFTK
jgi:hypothetical protein